MSSAVTSTSDSTAPGNSQTFKKIATKVFIQQVLPLRTSIIYFQYFLSCTAALVAETVTYPLDITKTRLQIARNKFTKGGICEFFDDSCFLISLNFQGWCK